MAVPFIPELPGAMTALDLYAPWFEGIEEPATMLEIRLALAEYRQRHGPDHWQLYLVQQGRA